MNRKTAPGNRKSRGPVKLNKRKSQSAECLLSLVEINTDRKASTPTFDRTTQSDSPNLSCIDKHLDRGSNAELNKTKLCKSAPNKETVNNNDLEKMIEHEFMLAIQSSMKCELAKRKASEVADSLNGLQERMDKSKKILEKTSQRLKSVNFSKEIDLLHSLHHQNYAKVLESFGGSSCEEKLSELQQKLEDEQNLLQLKNITVPSSGGDALCSIMAETTHLLRELQVNSEIEQTSEVLKEVSNINTATTNTLESCTSKLAQAERLVLERKTLESSLHHYLQLDQPPSTD